MRLFRDAVNVGNVLSAGNGILNFKFAAVLIAMLAVSLGVFSDATSVNAAEGDAVVIYSDEATTTTYDFITSPVNAVGDHWNTMCTATPAVDPGDTWNNPIPAYDTGSHPWTGANWIGGDWIYADPDQYATPRGWSSYDVDVSGLSGSATISYAGDNCTWVYLDGVLEDSFLDGIDTNLGAGTFTVEDLTGVSDLTFILFNVDFQGALKFRVDGLEGPAAPLIYEVSQGANTWLVSPITTDPPQTAEDYYDYDNTYDFSSNTGEEVEDESLLFLYFDPFAVDDPVSLIITHDIDQDADIANVDLTGGSANMDISGLDPTAHIVTSDDDLTPDEFRWSTTEPNTVIGRWNWGTCCTDGGALNLGTGDVDIEIDPDFGTNNGIDAWKLFVDGVWIPLDMTESVFITRTTINADHDGDTYLDAD